MKNLAQEKVGSIVATNFRTSKVFASRNIDFCCNGGITLAQACHNKNQDLELVLAELGDILKQEDDPKWQHLDLDELIDWIIEKHHAYILATIPALRIYLEKLCKVHGERHPELFEIRSLFEDGATALLRHMEKEEKILFPYIKAMVASERSGFTLSKPHFEHVESPIQMMEQEHANEGNRFAKISLLTERYTCPPDACQTYRVAYAILQEFEEDLHTHIHIENNILFPETRILFDKIILKADRHHF